ncbi:hypothetical protein Q7P35_003406 [Cladosporium inversicolor]
MSDDISRDVPQMLVIIVQRFLCKSEFYSQPALLYLASAKAYSRLNVSEAEKFQDFPDFLPYAQPDSDAESTAWPMVCEHAHPCPPVPSLDADGAWRWAKGRMLTDGVISQRRQRLGIVTASVEATRGRKNDIRLAAYKRVSGVGDAEGARQSIVRSSIRADLSTVLEMGRKAPAALIGDQRMLAAHRQSVELSVDA